MSTTFAEPTWGEVDPATLSRILVVSPHFDDAAMGAGHLIASYDDTTVVTVLGGEPPAYPDEPSEWDALGGFVAGDDVVAVRRQEDAAAMAVLESGYEWLEFADHQYLAPPDRPTPSDVAPVLAVTIAEFDPTAVFFPMGLGNPDHVMVHDACLLVRQEQPEREWFCYEDHGYKHIPGLLAWRVAKLLRSQPWPTPAIVPHEPDEERKRRAIWCYTSQIAPLEQDHALSARDGRARPRAVLAVGSPAVGVGRAGRLHLRPGAPRPARGESGGPSTEPGVPLLRCPAVRSPVLEGPADLTPPIVLSREPENKGVGQSSHGGNPARRGGASRRPDQAMAGWGAISPISTLSSAMSSGARSRSTSMSARIPGRRRLTMNNQVAPTAIHPKKM